LDGLVDRVYAYSFIATNLDVSTPAKAIAVEAWHRMRTDIEDRIRDAKHGAALRHLPSASRAANNVWMWGALLAVNLSAWLQELAGLDGGDGRGRAHLDTLRHRLLNVPARLVRHAGQITLRLPPGQHLLAQVLARLRRLPICT
jgi:Transposase DDE domain group 1